MRDDPDRYIYEPIRKGGDIPLPKEIAGGIEDVSLRGGWNCPAAPEFALPTETWREQYTDAGDEAAWLALFERQILAAMFTEAECQELSTVIWLGDNLWLHFQESNGVVKMFLEISPRPSQDAIEVHWPEILAWRDRLQVWQGPWSTGGKELLGLELHTRNTRGESYKCLAADLNARIAQALVSWKDEQARASLMNEQSDVKVEFNGYGGAAVLLDEWDLRTKRSRPGVNLVWKILLPRGLPFFPDN